MSGAADRGRLDRAEVVALVREWHGALERHVDVAELRGRLVRSGLLLRLPGATVRDAEQFEAWYRELSDSCFDQRRDVLSVAVDLVSPLHAEVTVTLRWESRRWQRPAPRSRWTGCLLTEQWLVVLQDGEPRIRTLVTWTAQPLPGSPPPLGDATSSATSRPRPVAEITGTAPAPNPANGTAQPIAETTEPATGLSPATGADQPQPVVEAVPPAARITARPAAAGRPGDGDTRESRGELVAS